MRYYLETTVFTYLVLDDGEKGKIASDILEAMQNGAFTGVTSFVTFEELVFVVWKNLGREEAIKAGTNFLNLTNLEIAASTRDTAQITMEEMTQKKLRPRDATHCATVKERGLAEMVTEDRDFNRAKEIRKYRLRAFAEKVGKGDKAAL